MAEKQDTIGATFDLYMNQEPMSKDKLSKMHAEIEAEQAAHATKERDEIDAYVARQIWDQDA